MKSWSEMPFRGTEDLFSCRSPSSRDVVSGTRPPPSVCGPAGWYTRRGVPDRYLVLLPLVVDAAIGRLFYVDGEKASLPR